MKVREGRHADVVTRGKSLGFEYGGAAEAESERIAAGLLSGDPDLQESALEDLKLSPGLARNVQSLVRAEGHYNLARMIGAMADQYISSREASPRITESELRLVIRKRLIEKAAAESSEILNEKVRSSNSYIDVQDGEYTYRLRAGGKIYIIKSPADPKVSKENPKRVPSKSRFYKEISKVIREKEPINAASLFSYKPSQVDKNRNVDSGRDTGSDTGKPREEIDESVEWFAPFYDMKLTFPTSDPASILKSRKKVKVMECRAGGCAAWVGDILRSAWVGGSIGDAWIAYNRDPLCYSQKFSAIKEGATPDDFNEMAKIFSDANQLGSDGEALKGSGSLKSRTMRWMMKFIPDQKSLADKLELGDVVGMFHYDSTYHAYALSESVSGRKLKGGFAYAPRVVTEDGSPWTQEMRGKDIKFKPSDDVLSGNIVPTPNTHVGIVGAKINGVPVIFHYIGDEATREGVVYASHLNMLAPSAGNDAIIWIASASSSGLVAKGGSFFRSIYKGAESVLKGAGSALSTLVDYFSEE